MEVKVTEVSIGKILEVEMAEGESIKAQPGAVISSLGEIEVTSEMGGLMSGLMRMAGGESAFINTITAKGKAHVILGPDFPSDIKELKLDNEEYLLGDGVYLAHTGEIEISSKFGGATAFLSGSGLFFQRASGSGTLYISGEGEILEATLNEGETILVDNANFVGCHSNMDIEKIILGKGLKSKLFGGEAFFFKITGPGKVLVRTYAMSSIANSMMKYLPRK